MVVLDEGVLHAGLGEDARAIGLHEEAALVAVHVRLEQQGPLKWCVPHAHWPRRLVASTCRDGLRTVLFTLGVMSAELVPAFPCHDRLAADAS